MGDHGTKRLARAQFALMPIELLETAISSGKKGAIFIYLFLWHYAGTDDNAWPSLHKLANECKMNPQDARNSIKWLILEGWITKDARVGTTAVYHVRQEHPSPRRPSKGQKADSGKATPVPKGTRGGGTERYQGVVPKGTGGVVPFGTPNNNQLTRTNEQDLPPIGPPAISVEVMAADAAPRSGEGNGKFRPSQADVPWGLVKAEAELLDFWASKGGCKSSRAWKVLMAELEKILQAPDGGLEVVRDQLRQATQAGWRSVTHTKWLAYGRPRNQQPRLTRQQQAVENVIAFLEHQENPNQTYSAQDSWESLHNTSSAPSWACSS